MSTQTTQGSGVTNNAGGSVLHGGNVSSSLLRNNSAIQSTFKSYNWGLPFASPFNYIQSIQLGGAVSITAITQSGSTGYVNIQKSSHGLAVGDLIAVYGTDVTGYNTVHRVTVVTDANNVKTDVFYSANTSTHGSYKAFSGNFNTMLAGSYIAKIIGKNTSGTSIDNLRILGSNPTSRKSIATAVGNYRYNITGWNALTGAATKGANAGDSFTYTNIGSGSSLASEPEPTRSIPGQFVYSIGTQIPTRDDYNSQAG